ncbi:MAG: NAD(P)H-binding protein [Ignavibacteriales bacterium]|nr:NAD(P)H-binding protein [Ignavibacteriales bacterium]
MNTRSALVVGASGLVGGHLLALLLADDTYSRVIVLTRKSLGFEHPKLLERVVNFDQLEQQQNLIKGEDVFCCLGTTIKAAGSQEAFRKVDFTYVVQTAAISQKNGARQFLVISSLGADIHSRIFYNRVKGEMEEAVAKVPFDAVRIFRPSLLLGERRESRPAEALGTFFVKALSVLLFIGGMRRYRAVHAQTAAKAMLRATKQQVKGVEILESEEIQSLGLL